MTLDERIQEVLNWRHDQRSKVAWDFETDCGLIREIVCDHWHRQLKFEIAKDMRAMKYAKVAMEFETKLNTVRALWACEYEAAYEGE